MAKYNIGIDTGGTYTDAVIVEMRQVTVLSLRPRALAAVTKSSLSVSNMLLLVSLMKTPHSTKPRANEGRKRYLKATTNLYMLPSSKLSTV